MAELPKANPACKAKQTEARAKSLARPPTPAQSCGEASNRVNEGAAMRHWLARKLTAQEALDIYVLARSGRYYQAEIAAAFGISQSHDR